MKAITILEPWASLIAFGKKKIETRNWCTDYRGPIAIHAAKSNKIVDYPFYLNEIPPCLKLMYEIMVRNNLQHKSLGYLSNHLNLGCIIATAELVDCKKILGTEDEDVTIKKIGKVTISNSKIILDGNEKINGIDECEIGDYSPGRYALFFEKVQLLRAPIKIKGKTRLWEITNLGL